MAGRSAAATPGVSAGEVFGLIRDQRTVTRADIRAATGLSRTAVTARVEQLLRVGLVAERTEGGSTGGRPPSRLVFDPKAGAVLVASIGASRVQVAVCDLAGLVLAESEFAVRRTVDASTVLTTAAEHLEAVLEKVSPPSVYGTGISVPSAVEAATGHSMSPAGGPERGAVAVAEFFTARFGAPVRVDSDVNVLALAEHARRAGVDDLLLLKISTGIGAGIIAGGRLQRGAWGAAGEIGHIKIADAADRPCRCGDRQCLETVAAGWALLDQFADLGRSVSGLTELVELAGVGDPDAVRLLREAGRRIGDVVAAAVNILNPAVIVVRGDLSHAFEPLAAGLRERIYQCSSASATRALHIEPGVSNAPTGVQACAAMILDHVLEPVAVNARLHANA